MFFSKGNRLNNIFALSYRNLRKKSKFRPSGYGVAYPCRRLQCPENGKITTANFTVSCTLSLSLSLVHHPRVSWLTYLKSYTFVWVETHCPALSSETRRATTILSWVISKQQGYFLSSAIVLDIFCWNAFTWYNRCRSFGSNHVAVFRPICWERGRRRKNWQQFNNWQFDNKSFGEISTRLWPRRLSRQV